MAGYLTTHVLDMARGCPAKGIKIELYRIDGAERRLIRTFATNDDGRTDSHILPEEEFETGVYELVFHAGTYLDRSGPSPNRTGASPARFLNVIPIRFGMAEQAHYHVPLLLSPFGYSTYRGS